MGAFAMPSLPSVRNLLDPSPPVFYPANKISKPKSERHGPGPGNGNDSSKEGADDRERARESQPRTRSSSQSLPHPPRSNTIQTFLPKASASMVDLTGEWEPIPRGRGVRRSSISSEVIRPDGNDLIGERESDSPLRPIHRRAQSAVPGLRAPIPTRAPLGRLTEFSRNPLASSSVISLPMLAEMDTYHHHHAASLPPSPIVRPRHRPSSRASPICHPLPHPLDGREPISPLAASLPLPTTTNTHNQNSSSVPPPQPQPQSTTNMPPPPLPRHRPLPSSRSISAQDVRLGIGGGLKRHSSLTTNSRRPSLGTSSLSDVQVLAKWSFPTSPERDGIGSGSPSHSVGRPSNRLRERLRSLSSLNTVVQAPDLVPNDSPRTTTTPTEYNHFTPTAPFKTPLKPLLTHRHTHSSPTSLERPFAVPQPAFQRRPTTSLLRKPDPLNMPGSRKDKKKDPQLQSGYSPGSLVSDNSSLRCPSVESLALPVERDDEVHTFPSHPSLVSLGSRTGLWSWRQRDEGVVGIGTETGTATERSIKMGGTRYDIHRLSERNEDNCGEVQEGGGGGGEEEYLGMDDI